MKKGLKKIMSLMLAMMLVLGMGVTALAAEGGNDADTESTKYAITVPSDDNHTYEIWQIFTGDWSSTKVKDDEGKEIEREVLSNVKWGANSKPTDGAKVSEKVDSTILDALADLKSDKAVTDYIQQYVNFKTTAVETVTKAAPASVVPGYYLIKDRDSDFTDEKDEGRTLYIVKVVGATTINRKADKPTVDKKVQENSNQVWDVKADYNIGEKVPFELIGTLPNNYDMYDAYKYVFHDTLSAGLTYDSDSLLVYVVTVDSNGDLPEPLGTPINNENYILNTTDHSVEVAFNVEKNEDGDYTNTGLKKVVPDYNANTRIVVRYTAALNVNAVIGQDGNSNEVSLEYSNNPNKGHEGETGKTPKKKVVVFTFELEGNKVDGKDKTTPLDGAEFKLYRTTSTGESEYVLVGTNGKVTGWTKTEGDGSVLTSAATGLFTISGLDADTYYLKEIKAPIGYNLLEEVITIVVTPEYTTNAGDTTITNLTATVQVGKDAATNATAAQNDSKKYTGILGFKVENNKGPVLPETGGIGTTMFYILGGVLVLGCSVILITRKRMSRR